MNDLVSIVLPVYNGEKYLSESIDSILAQSYRNWELIVVDDCSTDSTPTIVRAYADRDERIKYYRNEQNLKLPKSLNKGFSLTKGYYLTWTSDDNKYRPNAIDCLVHALKENKCDFVFTAYSRIDENGKRIDDKVFDKNIIKQIPIANVVGPSFMYTRKVYEKTGEYDTSLFLTEDFDYWQRVCGRFCAVYKKNIIYDYRVHGDSLTDTKDEKEFSQILCKTIMKNRNLFGRFSIKMNRSYYGILSRDKELHDEPNIYSTRYKWYTFLYYLIYFVPETIMRKTRGLIKKSEKTND